MKFDSEVVRVIGLMSGTSMDGVDVAVIETDGASQLAFGGTFFRPYGDADRDLLGRAIARAAEIGRAESDGVIAQAEAAVTMRHAEAVEAFLEEQGRDRLAIALVGFHGQTILHRPEQGVTVQLGDGQALARRLRIPVVFDFRKADVKAGGQGAPFAPIYHVALAEAAGLPKPLAFLNLGGVANVTLAPAFGDPVACDTGPGNALLDDLMLSRTGERLDRDGATAARGHVDAPTLARLLANPYFALPAPKSLDRNAFVGAEVDGLSLEDAAATLVAFTAETAASAIRNLGEQVETVVACGGGARNPTLMQALRERLPCDIRTADQLGWSAEFLEAQAFAYLAVRSVRGKPLSFPTTTGVPRALSGGALALPA